MDRKKGDLVKKRVTTIVLTVSIIGVVVWSLIPRPLPVDVGTVEIGDYEQRVVEDGRTRVKEKYVVSSPVDGVLPRVHWDPGDFVKKGDKLVTIKWDYDRVVHAPASGSILRILTKDEGFIYKGKPILEIGDPKSLEIVVDVLTSNAILLSLGNQVEITNWGGDQPLEGKIVRIEPSAFTKVSALGVDEQRVNVVIEITSPREQWLNLGDHFQVECRILVKRLENVLTVPTGALFQKGGKWAVFVFTQGKANLREIEISDQGPLKSVIGSGLNEGERVILYPGDRIDDGVAVKPTPGSAS
ncbi:MAG: efflux RND transporter periplasmic adaptor subunit [Bdellovibrionaceae bacterium]|nr:efflux RND transporter periplasmic adaptor subunit [Bdellovibrionales bacterium]MCB9085049.1 efflux RND transporter periplasmic adaptor subunit [Pseudobdellovibrionaceae bacterium]